MELFHAVKTHRQALTVCAVTDACLSNYGTKIYSDPFDASAPCTVRIYYQSSIEFLMRVTIFIATIQQKIEESAMKHLYLASLMKDYRQKTFDLIRTDEAGPTTPALVGPKVLLFMVNALYFQSCGRTSNCQIEVLFNGRTNLVLLPPSLLI